MMQFGALVRILTHAASVAPAAKSNCRWQVFGQPEGVKPALVTARDIQVQAREIVWPGDDHGPRMPARTDIRRRLDMPSPIPTPRLPPAMRG